MTDILINGVIKIYNKPTQSYSSSHSFPSDPNGHNKSKLASKSSNPLTYHSQNKGSKYIIKIE
jgi:hypothetical protein